MSKRLARHAVIALAVVLGTASSLALSTRSDASKPPGQDPPPPTGVPWSFRTVGVASLFEGDG